MSKLSNRIEKLENTAKPSKTTKWLRVVWQEDETKERALSRAGKVNPEAYSILYVVPVRPKGIRESIVINN